VDQPVPAGRTAEVVAPTLAGLTLADTGQGPVLLHPFRPGLVRRRFVQVPDEPARAGRLRPAALTRSALPTRPRGGRGDETRP